MRERNGYASLFFLQIFIALFFALSGLLYLTGYNTAGAQFIRGVGRLFGKNDLWRVIVALIQLFSGLGPLCRYFYQVKSEKPFPCFFNNYNSLDCKYCYAVFYRIISSAFFNGLAERSFSSDDYTFRIMGHYKAV